MNNIHPLNRKFTGILLFLSFLAPAIATFVFLQFQKEQVKEAVKSQVYAGMDKAKLVLLKFTEAEKENELDWEHSKEFEYHGEMYDVVEFETKGDTTYYWCWADKKETRLNTRLEELIAQTLGNNPRNQENGRRVHSFFKSLYFSDASEMEEVPFREMKTKSHFTPDSFQSPRFSPPMPPPDLV